MEIIHQSGNGRWCLVCVWCCYCRSRGHGGSLQVVPAPGQTLWAYKFCSHYQTCEQLCQAGATTEYSQCEYQHRTQPLYFSVKAISFSKQFIPFSLKLLCIYKTFLRCFFKMDPRCFFKSVQDMPCIHITICIQVKPRISYTNSTIILNMTTSLHIRSCTSLYVLLKEYNTTVIRKYHQWWSGEMSPNVKQRPLLPRSWIFF